MTGPLPELETLIARALEAAAIGFRRFRWLELVRSEVDADARALLVFVDAGSEPVVFLKLAWGARRAALATEHANLERLSSCDDDRLRRSVPRPLLFEHGAGFSTLAVTALPFTRMKDRPPEAYFRSPSFAVHLRSVTDWLVRLHRSLSGIAHGAPLDPARDVADFRRGYRRSAALDRLLDESIERLAAERPGPSPAHGDFCAANILIAPDDTLRIVDWEWPLAAGWPLGDFLYFAASVWCAPYGKGPAAREVSLERLYFDSTPLTDRLVSSARGMADDLAIDRKLLLPLSALAWTAFANRKHAAVGGAGPLADEVAARHLPLVVVRGGYCRNLELLAERPGQYRIGAAA